MASSLVRGKYIICKITGVASAEVVSDGAVFQRDGEIVEVGGYEELKARHPSEEVIGSPNYVVMPGLVNQHFHVGVTPFQMGVPDMPLELWMLRRMGARNVDPYLDQLYGAVQMIESGTTTVQALHSPGRGHSPADMEVADKVVKAYQDSGMRVSYAPMIADQNSLVSGPDGGEAEFAAQLPRDLAQRFTSFMARGYPPPDEVIPRLEEICAKYGNDRYPRVRIAVAPSNVHRCSDEMLMALRHLATRYGAGIHVHLQETVYQKLYGLREWGRTPLQHLYDLGFLGPDVTCGHSVWITDEDIRLMAETGTCVCHNASSNLRLQSGIAPIGRLLETGVRVALGSDEAGINDDKDLLQEMRLALKLHRLPGVDNVPPTSYQVFQMATANGAHSIWTGDNIGSLEPGKRADMVLLDLRNIEGPYLDPDVDLVDAVVHRGRSMDVDTVIVDGEVVMRDKRLIRIDKDALFKELKESLSQPPDPQELERRELTRQVEPYLRRFYEGSLPPISNPHTYYNARS